MKYVMMIILLVNMFEMYAQNINSIWAKSMSGINQEVGKCVAVDQSSNVYTAGYFTGMIDLDPGAANYSFTTNGMQDIFITKLNSSGNFIWGRQIGGIGNDMVYSMLVEQDGSILLTGFFHHSMDADPGLGTFYLNSTSSYSQDIFIIKLDTNASFVWAKSIGGSAYYDSLGNSFDAICNAYSLATDLNHNIYITGSFIGTIDFDPGPGLQLKASLSVRHIFIMKMDSLGNLMWIRTVGENKQGDEAYSIAVTPNGDCYISGVFADTMDIDPGPAIIHLCTQAYNGAFILKLNTDGEFIWGQQLSGDNLSDQATAFSIAISFDNDVYCSGIFKGSCNYGNSPMPSTLISQGNYDVFVMKISPTGNITWVKSVGGGNAEYCYSLRTDHLSNVLLCGSFKGIMDADPGTNVNNLVSTNLTNSDIFIMALNDNGDLINACQIGGIGNDLANAIYVDSLNHLFVTGYYSNTVDFDPDISVNNQTAIGSVDAFVLKLNDNSMILPLELIDFDVLEVEAGNLLKWQTSSTLNTALFEIQKSKDAIKFSTLAYIEVWETSSSHSNYLFNDTQILDMVNYYRLKAIDLDGQYSYSSIVCIQRKDEQAMFTAYPNPCNGELRLLSRKEMKDAVIRVTNTSGQVVYLKRNVSGNQFKCDLSHQTAGSYYIEIIERGTLNKEADMLHKLKIELKR